MKIVVTKFFKHTNRLFSALLITCCFILTVSPAFSQIDYSYGQNNKGLRVSLGLGGNVLQTTWTKKPVGYTLLAGVSYDINNYFTVQGEGQYGGLSGSDATNTYYYGKSVVSYFSGSINLRFSLGLFSDFESQNGFTDAIKRSYIGLGYGTIFSKVTLTKGNTTSPSGKTVPVDNPTINLAKSKGYTGVAEIPLNIGTNIAMPGVWGEDKVELNPNIQYNLFTQAGADGYQPSEKSANGGYILFSVSLRYKF